ncbi:hypothetical protein IEQ34_000994 [Dendrobium chrysotoxum]|uniref:Uncharacterized protein n=1 Tax=Dendrobium chrysotoxum TaxID=161865 RepID=A0AAV7HKD4_DENCH|nr:hypothetical protein IEQ34_000994 [Dendrobium chrysotoxum]
MLKWRGFPSLLCSLQIFREFKILIKILRLALVPRLPEYWWNWISLNDIRIVYGLGLKNLAIFKMW